MRAIAFVTCAVVWLLGGVATAQTPPKIEVRLHKESLSTSENRLTGITNVFFQATGDEELTLHPAWHDVEVAEVATGEAFEPVYAVRYSDRGSKTDSTRYLVDTDTDLNFTDEEPLHFREVGDLSVANAEVQIRPSETAEDTTAYLTDFQVIRSDDGYIYARISEYRRGQIELGGESYRVALRPSSRNDPLFAVSPNTRLLIDQDQDGAFQERWAVSDSGAVIESESVDITEPFLIGGRPFEALDVNPRGTRLVLQPSESEVAPAVDFATPALSAYDLSGKLHRLSDYAGHVVLLEFWSVHCPFSERTRPKLNAIAGQFGDDTLKVVALVREEDAEEVRRHLREHPKDAIILLSGDAAWEKFNPQGATPMIYLIDSEGTIRLQGRGASVVEPVEALIEELVSRE